MIIVVVPAVALALVSLAAFGGQWVWWLDVLANFRAQFAIVLLVLGLVVAVSRWRRTGLGILAVSLVNVIAVAPLFIGSPGEATAGAPEIRVMSFNLLSNNANYNEVIEYINAIHPDLVFLHESSRPWEVALESSDLDYRIVRTQAENLIFGTLVMIRGEGSVVSYGYSETQPRAVAIEYQPEDWPVQLHVLATHPLAPTTAQRAALRDAQLGFAAEWAADSERPTVVVGDFNASSWSWTFSRLVDAGLRNSQIGFGLQPSFPATTSLVFRVPIDHLLHSDELLVRDRFLGPAMGSDHFPLIVDLELKP
ncbi:MAG: endonuclease/exonuclease/phosphatase family protein [Acidimicrobiia bacterium]